jgi:hypothetical protein
VINSLHELSCLKEKYGNRVSLFGQIALIFPERNKLLKNTLAAIQLFEQYIPMESNCLEDFAKLAHKLINYNSKSIPTIDSVRNDLDKIYDLLKDENTDENTPPNFNINRVKSHEVLQMNQKTSSPIKMTKKFYSI